MVEQFDPHERRELDGLKAPPWPVPMDDFQRGGSTTMATHLMRALAALPPNECAARSRPAQTRTDSGSGEGHSGSNVMSARRRGVRLGSNYKPCRGSMPWQGCWFGPEWVAALGLRPARWPSSCDERSRQSRSGQMRAMGAHRERGRRTADRRRPAVRPLPL